MPSMVAIEEAPIPAAADILDLGQVFSYSGKRTISLKNKATSDLLWPFLLFYLAADQQTGGFVLLSFFKNKH